MRMMVSLAAGFWYRALPCRAPQIFLASAVAEAGRTRTAPQMRSWRQIRNLRHCTTAFYSTLVPSDGVSVVYKHGLPVINVVLPSRKERCQFIVKPMSMTVGNFLQDIQKEDRGIDTASICTAGVSVVYKHGLPVINVVLPSRKERCQFIVKPMSMTVGNFLQDIQKEDRGIDTASICTADGARFSSNTLMEVVLRSSFTLLINNTSYKVEPPVVEVENVSREHATQMDDIRSLVQTLYTALHLEGHQLNKERELLQKLDSLQEQLQPLERMKYGILENAQAKTTRLMWVGLALLSTQGGALAWLTWWVYSWDIMEPVTYFLTYGSAIAFYAYFVLTKQDYAYPGIKDRQCLNYFYKKAKKQRFDIEQYNKLKEDLAEVEANLRRLREPLQLKLPIQQLNAEH